MFGEKWKRIFFCGGKWIVKKNDILFLENNGSTLNINRLLMTVRLFRFGANK